MNNIKLPHKLGHWIANILDEFAICVARGIWEIGDYQIVATDWDDWNINKIYSVIGKKIVDIRPMGYPHKSSMGWQQQFERGLTEIVLNDGSVLFAMNEEDLCAGRIMCFDKDDKLFEISVENNNS